MRGIDSKEGQNAHLGGQKFKKLPKMTDFWQFNPSDGVVGGGESLTGGGGKCLHGTATAYDSYSTLSFVSKYRCFARNMIYNFMILFSQHSLSTCV